MQSKQRKNWGDCRNRFHSSENTVTFPLTEFRSCRNDLLGTKFKELFSHRILFWHHYFTGFLHRHKRTATDPHLQLRLYFALGIDKALTKKKSHYSAQESESDFRSWEQLWKGGYWLLFSVTSLRQKQVKRGEHDLGLKFRGYHTTWVKVSRQDCLQSMEAEVYGLRWGKGPQKEEERNHTAKRFYNQLGFIPNNTTIMFKNMS